MNCRSGLVKGPAMTGSTRHNPLFLMFASLTLAALVAGCAGQSTSNTSTSSSPDQGTTATSDSVQPGTYECSTFSGGELRAVAGGNFTIGDSHTYRDASGADGSYTVGGDLITFQGGAFDGKQAMYTQGVVHSAN